MFYHIHEEQGAFISYKSDFTETRGKLYTEKEIQTMLYAKDIDTEQEKSLITISETTRLRPIAVYVFCL